MQKELNKLSQPKSKRRLRDTLYGKLALFRKYLQSGTLTPSDESWLIETEVRLRPLNVSAILRITSVDRIEQLRPIMPSRLVITISASDLARHTCFEAKPIESESKMKELQSGESTYSVNLCEASRLWLT